MVFARYCKALLAMGQASCLVGARACIAAVGLLVLMAFPLVFLIPARADFGLVGNEVFAGGFVLIAGAAGALLFAQDVDGRYACYLRLVGFRKRDFAAFCAWQALPLSIALSLISTLTLSSPPFGAVPFFLLSLVLSEVAGAGFTALAVPLRFSGSRGTRSRGLRHSLPCPHKRVAALVFKSVKVTSPLYLVLSFVILLPLAFFLAFFLFPFPVYAYLLFALTTLFLNVFLDAEYANGKARFNRYYGVTVAESAWSKSAPTSVLYVAMTLIGLAWYLAPPSPTDIVLAVPVVAYGIVAQFGIASLLSRLRWRKEVNMILELLVLIFAFVPLLPLAGILLASSRKRMAT